MDSKKEEFACEGCQDSGESTKTGLGCTECCSHYEWDHDQCMDCGKERCPGEAIDRAMDYFEDR